MKAPQAHATFGLTPSKDDRPSNRLMSSAWPAMGVFLKHFTQTAGKSLSPIVTAGEATALRATITRLIPGDPARADQLYAARFGKSGPAAGNKLGWIKHFAASGKTLHALYAIDVLKDWLPTLTQGLDGERAANGLLSLAWDTPSLARAVNGETILLQAINRLVRATLQFHPKSSQGRLLRGAALMSAHITCHGFESLGRLAQDDMAKALESLIRPDGGHRTGRGDDLLRVILLVLPITIALGELKENVPDTVLHTMERMVPMLRMLTVADGGLTSLHGEAPHHEALAAVFAADRSGAETLEQAPYSAMSRIEYPTALVVADDASLAFEFCAGSARLATARIMANRQPVQPRNELVRSREGAVLRYEEGLSLRRSLFLSARGNDLRCEEFLASDECIVIEPASNVQIQPGPEDGFQLETPEREVWSGLPRGAAVVIEGHRILLLPDSSTRDGRVNWALKRLHG